MPRLIISERDQIIAMLNSKVNFSIISIFNCSVKTIRRIKSKYYQHGSVEDLPRSGRPSVTTEEKRDVMSEATKGTDFWQLLKHLAAKEFRSELSGSSWEALEFTVGGLWEGQFSLVATDKRGWDGLNQSYHVLLKIGPKFCSQTNHAFVWMLIQEASDDGEQMAPVILEGMSTNLIDFDQKVLWSGEAFRETISQTWFWWLERSMPSGILVMCPFSETPNVFALQQDNAPAHVASSTLSYLRDQNILLLSWPPFSPDLNPIEHVWAWMKKRVRQKNPQNLMDMAVAILEVWRTLPENFLKKLIESMPRRIEACIRARGGRTRY